MALEPSGSKARMARICASGAAPISLPWRRSDRRWRCRACAACLRAAGGDLSVAIASKLSATAPARSGCAASMALNRSPPRDIWLPSRQCMRLRQMQFGEFILRRVAFGFRLYLVSALLQARTDNSAAPRRRSCRLQARARRCAPSGGRECASDTMSCRPIGSPAAPAASAGAAAASASICCGVTVLRSSITTSSGTRRRSLAAGALLGLAVSCLCRRRRGRRGRSNRRLRRRCHRR